MFNFIVNNYRKAQCSILVENLINRTSSNLDQTANISHLARHIVERGWPEYSNLLKALEVKTSTKWSATIFLIASEANYSLKEAPAEINIKITSVLVTAFQLLLDEIPLNLPKNNKNIQDWLVIAEAIKITEPLIELIESRTDHKKT